MSARILYVEDNEQNFYLINFILDARGHELHWAKDGQAGLDLATREPFDLVLLDIQLPLMDGYTVAARLRGFPKFAAVPIVALTSYAMTGDREKALAAGCTGYIEKPINPQTFADQIEHYLTGSRRTKVEP
jgi:two-component system, cell cycle response regulator DivK